MDAFQGTSLAVMSKHTEINHDMVSFYFTNIVESGFSIAFNDVQLILLRNRALKEWSDGVLPSKGEVMLTFKINGILPVFNGQQMNGSCFRGTARIWAKVNAAEKLLSTEADGPVFISWGVGSFRRDAETDRTSGKCRKGRSTCWLKWKQSARHLSR